MGNGIGEIFWIFLMLSMLQPWVRQKMLDSARLRLMHRMERQRGSRVILLVHRQETMSFLGTRIHGGINLCYATPLTMACVRRLVLDVILAPCDALSQFRPACCYWHCC
jgi:hypothetical protein